VLSWFRVFVSVLAVGAGVLADTVASPRLVQIDLFATDARGRTVADLKAGDFELREDGVRQPIEAARFVAPPAPADDDGRAFALFLDEYHVGAANTARVRDALTRFVDQELGPRDLVAVMKPLDSLFAIHLTRDRDGVRQAIASFAGRKGDLEPRNSYERNYIAGTPARIETARNQVAWSAINALAAHLGAAGDRRKTLIVVSEGIGATDRRRGQEYLATRDVVLRSANRANVAIYTVDPRPAPGDDADAAATRSLAADTNGEASAADLDGALHRAAADASGYYLVAYRTARPDDGRFHDVQVRTIRRGIQLRARKGFVAASPDDAFRAALLAKLAEPPHQAPPEPPLHASPLIRPWFGLSRGDAGRTRVTFVWEPAAIVPGDRTRKPPPARLVLTATSVDGSVRYQGTVMPTGPAAMDEPPVAPARAVFDVEPGRLRLQMSIQDVTAQVLDQDVRELSIRDLKGDVALGTLEILRARNAREFRTLDADAAVPVASREFSRTERLLIRFPAYGPSGADLSVSARLLSRMGQAMRDLPVAEKTPANERAIDLPLAGLAAGEYMIEVTATSGARNAKDRITFRVTS